MSKKKKQFLKVKVSGKAIDFVKKQSKKTLSTIRSGVSKTVKTASKNTKDACLKRSIAPLQKKYGRKFVFIKDGLLYVSIKILSSIGKEESLNKWQKQDIENENYTIFKKKPAVPLKQKMMNCFGAMIKKRLEKQISKIVGEKVTMPDLPGVEK